MTIPLQTELFDTFLGQSEGINSIILPDVFSSGGSKNLWINRYGRAKKILGYARANAAAITTDTGGSATRVRALIPYRSTGGGTTTRQLLGVFDDAVDEWEVWRSSDSGVSWTFVFDAGIGSINTVPDAAQFGDTLYMTNGVIAPRKWNGTTWSTAGRTQSPTPTAVAAGVTGNLSGAYKWRLLSIFTDGTRKAASLASASLAVQADQGTITWTADTDTTVTGYELYRSTGSGVIFYLVAYINTRTTASYTDNISDLTILENRVMEEHGDAPPTATFCEPHKQRLWWGRTSANPTRAYWSDPGLPEDVNPDNFLDFTDSETVGDVMTGMLGNFEGRLVVFTEKAIWTVSGTGDVIGNIVEWNRIHANVETGCIHHRTMRRMPAGVKFTDATGKVQQTTSAAVVYISSLKDIRLFDGENDLIISHALSTTIATLNYAQRAKSFCVPDTARSELTWCFAGGSSAEPNTAVTWNYRWGVWYPRDWNSFAHAVEMETATAASVLLAGEASTTTGGRVYTLWSGNSFDGANITSRWMTKTIYGRDPQTRAVTPSQRNRWRWLDLLFVADQVTTLTVEWLAGSAPDNGAAFGSTTVSPSVGYILAANNDRLLSVGGDRIAQGQETSLLRAKLERSSAPARFLHDEGIRIRVSDTATLGSWAIEAMSLGYQRLPGLQRRFQ